MLSFLRLNISAVTFLSVLTLLLVTIDTSGARAATAPRQVTFTFCKQSKCADGRAPEGSLVFDSAGNMYGTASGGGAHGHGEIFKITPSGQQQILYSFCSQPGCSDGSQPQSGVVMDSSGNLFGTAGAGANFGGVAYELTAGGTYQVLYQFCSQPLCVDGNTPQGTLTLDGNGNLFGTTYSGGAAGKGTVFEIPSGGTETVLYSFCSLAACADGALPTSSVIMDTDGNMYGTTQTGGANNRGTIFELAADNTESVLYSFCPQVNCTDGTYAFGGLSMDSKGDLFGTTIYGGGANSGTVFELPKGGTEMVLYSFCALANCADGKNPFSGVIVDKKGTIFGTTEYGGNNNDGTAFSLTSAGQLNWSDNFCNRTKCGDGSVPVAGLVRGPKNYLYGSTASGGTKGGGVLYKIRIPASE
jgi:uncharacterized repeat protein (TIGR03803 family)